MTVRSLAMKVLLNEMSLLQHLHELLDLQEVG